jgi:hypothetical protein
MITSFDRRNLPILRAAMTTALAAVEAQYGIKITVGNARFLPDNATFKIEMATVGTAGVANTREREDFKREAFRYGLNASDLDKEIGYGFSNDRYIIKGLNTRRSKYPIVATRVRDGKTILLTVAGVKSALLRSTGITLNPAPVPLTSDEDNEAEGEIQAIEGGQM